MSSGLEISGLPPSLAVTRAGDIAVIGLSRPEKRNALNDEMVLGLERVFTSLPQGIKCAIIYGAGAHFSAGLDLTELIRRDHLAMIQHSRMWHRAFERIESGPVPVVAVLQGAVVGGGLELAAAAHIRVAERSAYYALPEGQRGIYLGGGGSVRLSRLIGVARVMDMMLTGRTLTAGEGLTQGLSQYIAEPGEGMSRAMTLATRIASNTALTNFAVTQVLPRSAAGDAQSGYVLEALMAAAAESGPEAQSRLREFLDKQAGKVMPPR